MSCRVACLEGGAWGWTLFIIRIVAFLDFFSLCNRTFSHSISMVDSDRVMCERERIVQRPNDCNRKPKTETEKTLSRTRPICMRQLACATISHLSPLLFSLTRHPNRSFPFPNIFNLDSPLLRHLEKLFNLLCRPSRIPKERPSFHSTFSIPTIERSLFMTDLHGGGNAQFEALE